MLFVEKKLVTIQLELNLYHSSAVLGDNILLFFHKIEK